MDRKKILIIDDDVQSIELLKTRLIANGYEVTSATDGAVGLEKAKKENPDLILLDIKMPSMDGHTILCILRKHGEKTKTIPVIVLTAYAELKDLFDLERVNDYIVKPFDDQDLLLRISRVLKEEG